LRQAPGKPKRRIGPRWLFLAFGGIPIVVSAVGYVLSDGETKMGDDPSEDLAQT